MPTVAVATFSSIFPVFLAWHCALSLLSFDVIAKSLPRWTLALAQEAARDFFFVFLLVFFDGDVLKRIQTACEELLFKGC